MENTVKENRATKITNYRDLEIWQLGKKITLEIYNLTQNFPNSELYTLSSQMRRCAISIPSNIAEGFNRYHNKEYKQFLYIALGSCAELDTQIEISRDLNYITQNLHSQISEAINHETRMIRNLIKKL